MKIKGLRKKISCVVIFPLLIGLILTRLAAFLPLYLYYPTILNSYTNKMIENQTVTLLSISSLLSSSTSVNYMQKIVNALNVAGDVMESYLFYNLAVKPSFDPSLVYLSASIFDEYYPNSTVLNDNLSLWYINDNITSPSRLPLASQVNLNTSGIFNSIIKPVSELGNYISTTYSLSYLVFSADGLLYTHPATYFPLVGEYPSAVCAYNEEDPTHYEPRCRPFYTVTLAAKTNEVVFTRPYLYLDSNIRGESACRGQWNYTNANMIMVYCVDFLVDLSLQNSMVYMTSDLIYSYILDANGGVMYYPDLQTTTDSLESITELEFPGEPYGEEALEFNLTILPLFLNQRTQVASYQRNGKEMTIAVTPVLMQMGYGSAPTHVASVGVVMKKSTLEESFNSLEDTCNNMLYIELYASVGLLVLIGAFCIFLTDKISSSVVAPIDHLLSILGRMKKDDLSMDILASYIPSPPEIACLYEVFDKLRVVLRFNKIPHEDPTVTSLIYSQALNLFTNFGNLTAMEICSRELGCIFYKKGLWEEAAEYLYSGYQLAESSGHYGEVEMARRKVETANGLVKAGVRRALAMQMYGEALELFKARGGVPDIVGCLLDMAEAVYEAQERKRQVLEELEEYLKSEEYPNREIANQRYLYCRGMQLINTNQLREGCRCLASAIEDFAVYHPGTREKAMAKICAIFEENLDQSITVENRSRHKDIVLVVSSSLVSGPVTWKIPGLLAGVMGEHDRLSLIQFHSSVQLVFNLTKLPLQFFDLKRPELGEGAVMYDAMAEGIKQFSILNEFPEQEHDERDLWMIVVTDRRDMLSKTSGEGVIRKIDEFKMHVVIVNCGVEENCFQTLVQDTRLGTVFEIGSDNQAALVFKQLEAYLCPNREVFIN